jgi:hypothetical protein
MTCARFRSSTALLVALAPLCGADVLTVGPPGSGSQFTQIQAAVDAAQPDDVLLVRPGTYQPIVVETPVRILGVAPGVIVEGVPDQPAVTVRGIGAGQEFVLSGTRVRAQGFFTRPNTIVLENSAGTLVLQNVTIVQDPFEGSLVGVRSTACARVLLLGSRILSAGELDTQTGAVVVQQGDLWIAGCEIRGSDDPYFALSGPHGVQATDATVRVWRSQIVGGDSDGKNGIGDAQGGDGIRATRTSVELYGGPGTLVRGGDGEEALFEEGFGGPGVELLDHSSARIQADVPITGGLDGFDLTQAPPVRADGTSAFVLDPKVFPSLASDVPRVQPGSSFTLTLDGSAGAYQVLYLSIRTGPTATFRRVDGAGLLDPTSLQQLAPAILPPSGSLEVAIAVPDDLALIGTTLFFQTAERFPNGFVLGAPGMANRFGISNPVLVPITE